MAVARSYRQTSIARTEYVGLEPLDKRNDPYSHNPTAWMIIKNGFLPDGRPPSDPCAHD